jgi:type II secretory pathway pseudopilin PulG
MKKFFTKQNRGFTLVETLVAISIFTLSILAMMSVLASGISDTNYAKQKMTATYLAQEGIETMRNTRDTYVLYPNSGNDWDSFKADYMGEADYPATPDFPFHRHSTMSQININEVKVSYTVSWSQGSGNYSITLSEFLFNWIE